VLVPRSLLESVLSTALARGGSFAEVFVQDKRSFSLVLEEEQLERAQLGRERGAGVRVQVGEVTGFAFTDDLDERALLEAAAAASALGQAAAGTARVDLRVGRRAAVNAEQERPEARAARELASLLWAADGAARAEGVAVRQVQTRLSHSRQRVTIASTDGLLVSDERRELQLFVGVTAQRDELRQIARRVRGGQGGLELLAGGEPERLGREAAAAAIELLEARPAPAGQMPVVVSNGWGGVLFHEAVGHGLEADHVVKNSSVYNGKVGQRVASPEVSLVDDATVLNHRGSFRFDDEGAPGQRTVLVEQGLLRGFLTDRRSAGQLGLRRSGNGRRQSYQHLPLPRMTNLYIQPGVGSAEALLADTPRGLYVRSLGGGMVDPASGQFVFSVTEGFLIEGGRLGPPVRGATLAGNSFQVLADIDAVADDFELDPGLGNCGKSGQWVPVGVGQPTLRVRELVVGGTV
jgi:TldD protein